MDNLPAHLFHIIFEKSPGSLLIKTDAPKFTIVAASDSFLKTTGVSRDDVVERGFFEIFHDDIAQTDDLIARKIFNRVIRTGDKVDVPVYQYDVPDPGGVVKMQRYWSFSNIPISDNGQSVAYILCTFTDITAEVKAKEAAQDSEHRLLLAAEATGMAIWDLALPNLDFTFSAQMPAIFGHAPGTYINLEVIRKQVHHDDMQNIVLKAFNDALTSGNYFYEVRVFWPDNSLHWIRTKGIVLYNKNKEPVRMLGTILDITESKRDEIRKNDFIAMASHELKTPLTSLKAYLQLLESKLAGTSDPFIKTAVAKSGKQVNKMTALIRGFLDLSRLEPGQLLLNRTDFDINRMIAETISESRILNQTHVLRSESSGELMVNADRAKIGQVISNLISNAVKYSPKGSHVIIQSRKQTDSIQVSVADEGIGIKLKERDKIFQRFYRSEDEEMRNISGFGIGLYLSSEIIQRHKGKIWVESEEGKGSTFYFSLPATV